MKKFEHEVLSFDANGKKEYAAMQATLREWGESGFEIVSVVGTSMNGSDFTVFLKREVNNNADNEGEQNV
ncbi:hypothetical protein [Loktanella sp. Alg231-35]|uniref:hypothetical protein n=1 Tax=Loktanella sp. Alg231-35 TaxID=1922220 RepID=UPI000D55DC30|nr:hypothetical protein [Loktanella sp. Alg231-35]